MAHSIHLSGHLPQNPNFWQFFYFSFVTLATLGYGDITPKSDLVKGLVIIEVVLGVGWVTVIFAAVIAHLQSKFSEIAKTQQQLVETLKQNQREY